MKSSFEVANGVAQGTMSSEFGQGKKFVRGLTKIAISGLAYSNGVDVVLQANFDPIRRFVKYGGTRRQVLMLAASDKKYVLAIESVSKNVDGYYCVVIRIGFCSFLIDLSPGNSLFPELHAKCAELYGIRGWCVI